MVEKRSYDRLVARIEALARRVSELCRRQDKTLQHWLDNEEVCLRNGPCSVTANGA